MAHNRSGYSTSKANLNVPNQIKCSRCNRVKGKAAFSSVQQKNLVVEHSRKPDFDVQKVGYVPCIPCSGGQVVELTCMMCNQTKDKEKFAKAQRSNPDRAICWPCREEIANDEPGGFDDDDSNGRSNSDDYDDSDDDMSAITSNTNGLSSRTYTCLRSSTIGSSGGVPLSTDGTDSSSIASASEVSTTKASTGGWSTSRSYKAPPCKEHLSNDPRKFAKIRAVPRRVEYDLAREHKKDDNSTEVDDDETVYYSDDD